MLQDVLAALCALTVVFRLLIILGSIELEDFSHQGMNSSVTGELSS